ncbi:MAG: DUF3795 domain-containing protein [Smithellaceae bacterium]
MIQKELIAPCGLYCGVCSIYQATRSNNQKLKEKLAGFYHDTPDKINCKGCLSDTVYWYCKVCAIKSCTLEKKLEGCHRCDQFPCEIIEAFPVPEGKLNILRAVPEWRKLGTQQFALAEEERFSCPSCRTPSFRGARKCWICGTVLNTP